MYCYVKAVNCCWKYPINTLERELIGYEKKNKSVIYGIEYVLHVAYKFVICNGSIDILDQDVMYIKQMQHGVKNVILF